MESKERAGGLNEVCWLQEESALGLEVSLKVAE